MATTFRTRPNIRIDGAASAPADAIAGGAP
jgi:hypothetical protein